jgi:hypothetical protein
MIPKASCWSASPFSIISGVAYTMMVELSSDSSTNLVQTPAFRLFKGVDDSMRLSHRLALFKFSVKAGPGVASAASVVLCLGQNGRSGTRRARQFVYAVLQNGDHSLI